MAADERIHRAVPADGSQHFEAGAQRAQDKDWFSVAARSDALRQGLVDAARRLAATEDDAARLYGEIASHSRNRADDVRRLAEHARVSARRAREIADHYSRGD
ncbi:hypothetical protein [Nocardia sp. XZ_19_369]|uniref:hypothetical protein n=1 Tax=Nocardia sp. XZ_19_369 TaxID=2769487 RepID=UPI00188E8088|nr:hypothetical protein [Nocardia sp. XZ_19_369]